jgi:hypothetical protein
VKFSFRPSYKALKKGKSRVGLLVSRIRGKMLFLYARRRMITLPLLPAMTQSAARDEAIAAAIMELAQRTDYLKTRLEALEAVVKDRLDSLEDAMCGDLANLRIDLNNCRNVADVAFAYVDQVTDREAGRVCH